MGDVAIRTTVVSTGSAALAGAFASKSNDAASRALSGRSMFTSGLVRIANLWNRFEFHVHERSVTLDGTTDVDVLYQIARLRIDGDRTARTLELQPFHEVHRLVRIQHAVLRGNDFIDRRHHVERRGRTEVGNDRTVA